MRFGLTWFGKYRLVFDKQLKKGYLETAKCDSEFIKNNDAFGDSWPTIDAFELLLDCANGGGRKLALLYEFFPVFYCRILPFCFNPSDCRNR